MELLHPHISPSRAALRLSQNSYLNPEEKLTNHKNANASSLLYNSLETLQLKLSSSHKGFQTPNFLHHPLNNCIRPAEYADVGSFATIYLAICLHFHFYFLVIGLNFQKNFPRWLYGRMTKKSKVDIVVMKKKDQKKHQSTVSASIHHSRCI